MEVLHGKAFSDTRDCLLKDQIAFSEFLKKLLSLPLKTDEIR